MLTRAGRPSVAQAARAAALAVLVQTVGTAAPLAAEAGPPAASGSEAAAVERFGALPLQFEPNVGQFDERVEFVARGGGYTLFLTPGEAVLTLRREASVPDLSQRREGAKPQSPEVVRTRLVGASVSTSGEGVGELPGVTNYFIGNDPSLWRTGIVSYAAVRYREVYSGVDLVHYGNGGDLEYDFVVSPGADPSAIRMQIEGADRMTVDASGDLVMEVGGGELRQRAPAIYQEGPGGRERVSGGYVLRGDEVGFSVGSYDPARPLVLDPVLAYSRMFGANGEDSANAIVVGTDGSAYVTGSEQVYLAGFDVFVSKLSPSGALVYSTYLGSAGTDVGLGIAAGADGSIHVVGRTDSSDFPTLAPLQATYGGATDTFVARLSSSGGLAYSTYLGGTGYDSTDAIAVGADGSVYVSGSSSSTNFPTAAPLQPSLSGPSDAFVTKLAASGSSLVYSTYLGGSRSDSASGLAVGADGSVYVAGDTSSTNFPTAAPLQPSLSGPSDVFVTKIAPSGSALVFSTYLGGTSSDYAWAIAAGGDGGAYVTGSTISADFPTTNAIQASFSGVADAFVTKVSPSGLGLDYSTYLGGGDQDVGTAIAVGSDGSAYVTGWAWSTNFPVADTIQASNAGAQDLFVTKLSPTGRTLVYSTYFGGSASDFGYGIAVDAQGSAYVAGETTSTDYPLDQPPNCNCYEGEAVVMKFKDTIGPAQGTTPGVYVPNTAAWFLRNANTSGPADVVITYGDGASGAVPISGDWDGDGDSTPGLYDPATGAFFLRNANSPGPADLVFTFGVAGLGYVPLAGDWDGDGDDTIGLYAPASGAFFLRNANSPGPANVVFAYGVGGAGYVPLSGDWDGDGDDTPGLYNPASGAFFLRNANSGGPASHVFTFGAGDAGFVPLAGDWNDDGRDTVGLAAAATGTFFLKNANAPGAADIVFAYGPPGATPIVGDWDGL